jgi:hypothetical protein
MFESYLDLAGSGSTQIQELVARTQHWSASDIATAISGAKMRVMRQVLEATHFQQQQQQQEHGSETITSDMQPKLVPCQASDFGAIAIRFAEISTEQRAPIRKPSVVWMGMDDDSACVGRLL